MKRTTAAGAALALMFTLAACGDDDNGDNGTPGDTTTPVDTDPTGAPGDDTDPTGMPGDDTDTTGAPGDDTGAGSESMACEAFFGGPAPLEDRVEAAHDQLATGEWDVMTYGEVQLLSQRILELEAQADDEAEVLERINAPFVEITTGYQDALMDEDVEDPYADLPDADTADSEAALGELVEWCS